MRETNLKSGIKKHLGEKNNQKNDSNNKTTTISDEGTIDISITDDDLLAALEIDVRSLFLLLLIIFFHTS